MLDQLYRQFGKRSCDTVAAVVLAVVLSPLMLAVALLVRAFHGGPIVYQQVRAGHLGRPFVIYKFRTMTNARDSSGELLGDELRLTRFGKFLRSTSLDELPELWNVIKGEMSLVGPRPLLMRYLPLYSETQSRRHEVRPGITGLAQVRGRNSISWEDRFNFDVQYVDELSLRLDLRILIDTVSCVLRREGISAASHATSPLFLGSQSEEPTNTVEAA